MLTFVLGWSVWSLVCFLAYGLAQAAQRGDSAEALAAERAWGVVERRECEGRRR